MTQDKAQRQIAAILAELEKSTGQLVDGVRVESLDIRSYADPAPKWLRFVEIDMRPIPGSQWST